MTRNCQLFSLQQKHLIIQLSHLSCFHSLKQTCSKPFHVFSFFVNANWECLNSKNVSYRSVLHQRHCQVLWHNCPMNTLVIWVLSYMMCKCLHCHFNNSLHQEGAHFNRSFQSPRWEEYLQTCILRNSMLSVSCGCVAFDVKFPPQTFLRAELFSNIYS